MVHYKTIIICCGIFALLKLNNGEVFSPTPNYSSSFRSDDFININRRQYDRTIQDYDNQMEMFKKVFKARLSTIDTELEMVIDSLRLNDERLNPLEVLSDFSKHCVSKYRSRIPTAVTTKTNIQNCVVTARNQLNNLVSAPLTTRNNLHNYFKSNFEKEVTNCEKKNTGVSFNYTLCLTGLVYATNIVTLNNQKTFFTQMEAAECASNAHVKKAIDCSFLVQNRTIALTAEANTLINNCMENLNNSNDFCTDVFYMRQSLVDYKNFSMTNPFYGRNDTNNCLLIKLY